MRVKLPEGITACLFDLDGVITQTAKVHSASWKDAFDAYLRERAEQTGGPFVAFDAHHDYDLYVDGRPRADGVRSFLASRDIPADDALVARLGDAKNAQMLDHIANGDVEVYEGSVSFLKAARDQGLRRAVVSSSANTVAVLAAVGLTELFEARIDGVIAKERGLPGKPAPDAFLAGAAALEVDPAQAVVFEDAQVGVQAGRAGNFGYVVGVDRTGQADALREHGADVVVEDLEELLEP